MKRVMDLERIKQNLRLRSGRPKKQKKTQAPPSSQQQKQAIPNGVVNHEPSVPAPAKRDTANEAVTPEPEAQKESTQESNGTGAQSEQGHRSGSTTPTGRNGNNSDQGSIDRYGRSGIEKPKRSSSHAPPPSQQTMAEVTNESDNSDGHDYDLRPPAPRSKPPSLETTAELLFSAGHLNALLQEPQSVAKFTAFLNKYKPEYQPLILRYLETQKAIKAIEYANAIAEGAAKEQDAESSTPSTAATLDQAFAEASTSSFNALVGTALPMYTTYCLVKLVTECLVNEITGKQTPIMRNLVGGLSEVFCIADPNQEDTPIVYASEEFYRLTGYGTDDVIGRNCRFLQGGKTNPECPRRLRESIKKGEEHCETLLNYRRDGRPFINLLMIAPLHDNNGKVKYHIGAQVDVSGLIAGGRGLESFERYLQLKQNDRGRRRDNEQAESKQKSKALQKLQELSEMFDIEESAAVQSHSRASSMSRDDDIRSVGSTDRRQRRVFNDSDRSDQEEDEDDDEQKQDNDVWKLGQAGPSGLSGKLPGVYDTYMLIRAAPSLRIIFVSPKLRRIGNVVQTPFLAHVAAPQTTLSGLQESFNAGVPVSAKINFMAKSGENRGGTKTPPGTKLEDGKYGRICWISATPLLGSDDRVGVWMVVVVEKSKAGQSTRTAEVEARINAKAQNDNFSKKNVSQRTSTQSRPAEPQPEPEERPIKPKRLDDQADDLPNHEDPEPELTTSAEVGGGQQDAIDEANEDSDFVQTKQSPQTPQMNGRIHIDPDSEDDRAESPEWQPARESSNTASPQPGEDRKYTPPPEIPNSMQNATPPQSDFQADNEATPRRTRFDQDEEADDSPDHASSGKNRPSDMLPMDYLRHPGSRHGGQRGADNDKWSDLDCMKSPGLYSVD